MSTPFCFSTDQGEKLGIRQMTVECGKDEDCGRGEHLSNLEHRTTPRTEVLKPALNTDWVQRPSQHRPGFQTPQWNQEIPRLMRAWYPRSPGLASGEPTMAWYSEKEQGTYKTKLSYHATQPPAALTDIFPSGDENLRSPRTDVPSNP